MKVLIGCEESQTITAAMRKRGVEAYSCDLLDTRGRQEWHFKSCIFEQLNRQWDLIILHPPCTALCVSGNRWYGNGQERNADRLAAIRWTVELWEAAKKSAPRLALENPVSVVFQHLKYDNLQWVQPWQFGHGETKKTGFAVVGLPPLQPTKIATGRAQNVFRMAPGPTRARDRSKTYEGIAEAIAEQWTK